MRWVLEGGAALLHAAGSHRPSAHMLYAMMHRMAILLATSSCSAALIYYM